MSTGGALGRTTDRVLVAPVSLEASGGPRPAPSLPPEHEFRATLGRFATGVAVVTASTGHSHVGLTCQSLASLSLRPPMVMFAVSATSRSLQVLRAAGTAAVNVLSSGQSEISERFAATGVDRFAGLAWHPAPSGAPLIPGALAWVDCRVVSTYEQGDHVIVVGEVTWLRAQQDESPLVYFRGSYRSLSPMGE